MGISIIVERFAREILIKCYQNQEDLDSGSEVHAKFQCTAVGDLVTAVFKTCSFWGKFCGFEG